MRAPIAIALVLLAACGAASSSSSPAGGGATSIALNGRLVLERPLARGRFDASSPRVQKADAQLTAMLGHPLVFSFDAALVPKWEDDFEALSTAAIEGVAQQLAVLERIEPAMFAWAAPRFMRIEWDYDATREWGETTFDAASGKLRLVLTPKSEAVLEEHELGHALGRAYGADLGKRFADVDPTALSGDDDDAYFEWLSDFAHGFEDERIEKSWTAYKELDVASASVIRRMLRFDEAIRTRKSPVGPRVLDWLAKQGAYFAQVAAAFGSAHGRAGRPDKELYGSAFDARNGSTRSATPCASPRVGAPRGTRWARTTTSGRAIAIACSTA